ncbi:MAG: ribosome biogenesis GTPase Der [Alphaproteobacteria bacterium]
MSFTVAIVGRPNVGKSTLFNRLVGRRAALVADTPGVTRDRREGEGRIGPLAFTVIDTGGLAEAPPDSLEGRMQAQTERAASAAAVTLLVIDGRAGVTPDDRHFARALRRAGFAIVLVVNKCEGGAGDEGFFEAFSLGLGDPVAISAEHGEGMDGLYEALLPFGPAEAAGGAEEAVPGRPLQLAIVGRPNVGKSTLVNRLVGEERAITGPEPGITRDAIAVEWLHRDRPVVFVDTAGLRRRARVAEKIEKLSAADTLRAIRLAEVVVLVVDAEAMLEKQDLTIARMVADEGRAIVVAVNKWDLVRDTKQALGRLRDRLETSLPQIKGARFVTLSALTGKGLARLMPAVIAAYEVWNRRVATGALNRWLEAVTARHPPPLAGGRWIKLRYITQVKARPPTFVIFANVPEALPEAYRRYLVNGLRDDFDLPGTPVRIGLRRGKNPYAKAD